MRAGRQAARACKNSRLPSSRRTAPANAPPLVATTLTQSGTRPRTASAARLRQAPQFPTTQRPNPGYVRRVRHKRALNTETLKAARAPTSAAVRLSNCTPAQPLGIEAPYRRIIAGFGLLRLEITECRTSRWMQLYRKLLVVRL